MIFVNGADVQARWQDEFLVGSKFCIKSCMQMTAIQSSVVLRWLYQTHKCLSCGAVMTDYCHERMQNTQTSPCHINTSPTSRDRPGLDIRRCEWGSYFIELEWLLYRRTRLDHVAVHSAHSNSFWVPPSVTDWVSWKNKPSLMFLRPKCLQDS